MLESLGLNTLEGVQSANVSAVFPRQNFQQWDGGGNQEMVARPRAEIRFDTIWVSGLNSNYFGFLVSPSAVTSALLSMNQERNYYLLVNQAGIDSVAYAGTNAYVMSMGNGVVTRYDFTASVGSPTRVGFNVEGLNLLIQPSGTGQPLPAVYKQGGSGATGLYTLPAPVNLVRQYFEAMPGAIELSFDTGSAFGLRLSGQNSCPIDSFSFTIDLPRSEVQDLGWAYPNSRPIQWPAVINIQAQGTMNGFQQDALNRFRCPDSGYDFAVAFRNGCSSASNYAMRFRGAKLENQSLSVGVGEGSSKISLNWSLYVNDPRRSTPNYYVTDAGLTYNSVIFPQVEYVSGFAPLTFNLSESSYLAILSGPGVLSGNSVFVSDEETDTVVVRVNGTGGDVQDLTVTIAV